MGQPQPTTPEELARLLQRQIADLSGQIKANQRETDRLEEILNLRIEELAQLLLKKGESK